MDSVTYFNEWFSVSPADPGGFWLIPDKSNDPAEWAIMDSPDPVAEITTLRTRLDRAVAENEAWRSERLFIDGGAFVVLATPQSRSGKPFSTIDAAVDALMAEEE